MAPSTEAMSGLALAEAYDIQLNLEGRGLRAGDIVLTGSISEILRPKAGESVRAPFTGLGSVACRFV